MSGGISKEVEEETQEGTPKRAGFAEASAAGAIESRRASLEIAQKDLPSDLKYPVVFTCERDLLDELELLDASDLQVVLNDEGYAVLREMPGEQHRSSAHDGALILNIRSYVHACDESRILAIESRLR